MKFFNLFVVFIAVWALSACGITTDPGDKTPGDTTTPSQFLTLVTVGDHENTDNEGVTWGWANEDSLIEVESGDDLVFVFGYLRDTYRVEIKEWNTSGESVDGLPFALDYDEGNEQGVRTFNWTPEEEGEYHFSLWLSTQEGEPRADTPIKLVVVVGDEGTVNPDPDPDNELSNAIRWFNVTVADGSEVEDGDEIRPFGGISVNWSVVAVDRVEVTITSMGTEIYHSTAREHTRWISFDEIEDSNVVVRLRIEDDGKSYTRTIRFEVGVDDSGAGARGQMIFTFFPPSGYSAEEMRVRITNSRGHLVRYVDNGDRLELSEGQYYATLVEQNDFEIVRVERQCTRLSDGVVRFNMEDDENIRCHVYFEEVDYSDELCEDAVAKVFVSGDCYEYEVSISRSGPDFRLEWDLSAGYDRHYIQLYRVGVGDVYQSTSNSGSRTVDPSNLEPGEYEFRVTGYDNSVADLWLVTINVE